MFFDNNKLGQLIPLLSNNECQYVQNILLKHEHLWENHSSIYLYTFGSPIYLNSSEHEYYLKLKTANIILWDLFSWLYNRILGCLRTFICDDIVLPSCFAFPGYHIFKVSHQNCFNYGGIHIDQIYKNLKIKLAKPPTPNENLSITLSIKEPQCGSYIDRWDMAYPSIRSEFDLNRNTFTRFRLPEGKLFISSGDYWHRIGPINTNLMHDMRITLQGHLMKCDNTWLLCW